MNGTIHSDTLFSHHVVNVTMNFDTLTEENNLTVQKVSLLYSSYSAMILKILIYKVADLHKYSVISVISAWF